MRSTLPEHDVLPAPGGAHPVADGRRSTTASTVLRTVLDHGPLARSTVARLAGLSPAVVSRQSAELVASGLMREVAPMPAPRQAVGRPHVPVDIDVDRYLTCGVHIALGHSTVALMDLRGRVVAKVRIPHEGTSPSEILGHAADAAEAVLAEHAGERVVLGLGLATGGWVDPANGVIIRHGPLGWTDVPGAAVFERRLGLRTRLESHSRALAHAEQLIGRHTQRARSSMVHLFVGNVVDAAIATGGTVHHGPRSAAGDVSHLPLGTESALTARRCSCGRRGCLQSSVSAHSVVMHAVATGLLARPHYPDLLESLRAGAPKVVALFRQRARLIGRAVAILLDVINPELLVVTESSLAVSPVLMADLHTEIAERARPGTDPERTVVRGSFGEAALGVAASSIVLHEVFDRPLEFVRNNGD